MSTASVRGIRFEKFFRHRDEDGELKPDGEFPVVISTRNPSSKRRLQFSCTNMSSVILIQYPTGAFTYSFINRLYL
jgi:hypothetical protein